VSNSLVDYFLVMPSLS